VRVLILSAVIVFADQFSKLLVKGIAIPSLGVSIGGMVYGTSKPIIGDFFRLTYIENPGMAFGIDIGGKLFFSLFSIVASAAILIYLYRVRNEQLGFRVAIAMILGGAVGNLIDRVFYGVIFDEAPLFYGKVVDFFDVDFFNVNLFGYHLSRWPVFNIADACVTIGVLLLLVFHRTVPSHSYASGTLPSPAVIPVAERNDPVESSPLRDSSPGENSSNGYQQ
jgi:signal peptidase II